MKILVLDDRTVAKWVFVNPDLTYTEKTFLDGIDVCEVKTAGQAIGSLSPIEK